MPSVSYDSKSFFLDGAKSGIRRLALVGASLEPAVLAPAEWTPNLRALRRAGCNSVAVRVPWSLHEPTADRFDFEGPLDLRRFIVEAGAADLKVVLRIGPCVGGTLARAGLPAWVPELAGDSIRDAAPAFMQRVTRWWRRLVREWIDLQATRNGSSAERPVVAVGIENDWHSLDEEVGARYFGDLVRYAREFGVEVPLVSVNNCWFMREGVVDAWRMGARGGCARTALELREVQPDAPPVIVGLAHAASEVAGAIASRADFFVEVFGGTHATATAALGAAEMPMKGVGSLQRLLVFASTFGPLLAGLVPDPAPDGDGRSVLRGPGAERVFVTPSKTASGIAFHAADIAINGARLERCTGSLVALAGDLLVVAGRPRTKIRVRVDGSESVLTVPVDGRAPKVTRVRGLRIAVVPSSLADGVAIAADGFEFADSAGTPVASVTADGRVVRHKPVVRAKSAARGRSVKLGSFEMLAEPGLFDGSHPRFASTAAPRALGAYGVDSLHGYYRARLKPRAGSRRMLALPFARLGSGRVAIDGTAQACGSSPLFDLAPAKGPRCIVAEVRAPGFAMDAAPAGSHGELRAGVFGPLVDLAPLKGVRSEFVSMPAFDATRMGRFVLGYDMRDPARAAPRTLRWTFPPRTTPVVMRFPAWWVEASCVAGGDGGASRDALRLNGELVVAGQSAFSAELVWLDGSRLSPMRPKALAKGEKPPKAKAVRLEPGANEVVLDLDHRADHGSGPDLERLRREVAFLEVRGEVAAEWAFARIAPPASWARAVPLPRGTAPKATGIPTWFRAVFTRVAAGGCALEAVFDRGACATVFVNGACVLGQDGASGAPRGKGAQARLVRRVSLAHGALEGGCNEIAVFSPDGRAPALALHEA
jgi:hypothetical protein